MHVGMCKVTEVKIFTYNNLFSSQAYRYTILHERATALDKSRPGLPLSLQKVLEDGGESLY